MTSEEALSRIPTFRCKKGCFDCCLFSDVAVQVNADGSIIPSGRWFRIGKIAQQSEYKTCQSASEEGCKIYDRRGFLCRLYGASEALPDCPHGCGPEKKLTIEETKAIVRFLVQNELLNCPMYKITRKEIE